MQKATKNTSISFRFPEQYLVKYWIKKGEFWEQNEEMYYAKKKGYETYVERQWHRDHIGEEVKLVSITYY